jgi:hypothetical protein
MEARSQKNYEGKGESCTLCNSMKYNAQISARNKLKLSGLIWKAWENGEHENAVLGWPKSGSGSTLGTQNHHQQN